MSSIPFVKMHGAGNDFVVIFQKDLPKSTDIKLISQQICHRQLGVGADQLLLLSPKDNATYRMDIFNADGSQAQMCGNGLRCVADLLSQQKLINRQNTAIETLAGVRQVKWLEADDGGAIAVNMGRPNFKFAEILVRLPQGLEIAEAALVPIQVDGEHLSAVMVSMGNPHCVIFTSAAVQKRVAEIGPKLERHMYFPERANIMLARLVDDHTIEVAHWERGSGLTLACGSGACATAAAAIRRGIVNSPVTIKMSGGDINILWDGAREDDLWMSGPTAMVFKGEFYFKESSS